MVVVRSKYIAGRGSGGKGVGRALGHLKYIQHRPGPDREQGGRELFSDMEDRVDPSEVRKEIRTMGNQKVVVHKMMLAPEINVTDKKAFAREVVGELGKAKGLDLKYYGVEHNNTDHHHVHLVIYGKDRNGSEVNINKKDLDKVREFGERYLEREHPRELEQAREERKRKQQEKQLEWERQQKERYNQGLEIPWMHKKIIREQLEPYDQWRKNQDEKRIEKEQKKEKKQEERPKGRLEAVGKDWSKGNTLEELRELDQQLWDNYDQRLPKDQYKKLVGWIKEKEKEQERSSPEPDRKKEDKSKVQKDKDKDYFERDGKKYSFKDSYEKLTGLAKELRESDKRLPIEDYNKLRGWIEDKDRSRWRGALEKGLAQAKSQMKTPERPRTLEKAGGEIVNPLQQQLAGNPVFKVFMAAAGTAHELIRSIPLVENRDRLKEGQEEISKSKEELDQKINKDLKGTEIESKAKGHRDQLDKALEENKEGDKKRTKQTKIDKEKQEREQKDREWFERGGGWGR